MPDRLFPILEPHNQDNLCTSGPSSDEFYRFKVVKMSVEKEFLLGQNVLNGYGIHLHHIYLNL